MFTLSEVFPTSRPPEEFVRAFNITKSMRLSFCDPNSKQKADCSRFMSKNLTKRPLLRVSSDVDAGCEKRPLLWASKQSEVANDVLFEGSSPRLSVDYGTN